MNLVLSIFPGIDLLGRAFESEGFCVVRGPDLLWGGDIHAFHPPAGKFAGVIGGPPCQAFSQINQAARMGLQTMAENLIPEFERCVAEAQPRWFVMENVRQAPLPVVPGYGVDTHVLNNRWFGGVQNRLRAFSFGNMEGFGLLIGQEVVALEAIDKAGCFTANGSQWEADKGRSRGSRTWDDVRRGLELQGLPPDALDNIPFTAAGAVKAVGNGVPLIMGRAVARAVKRAMYPVAREAPMT